MLRLTLLCLFGLTCSQVSADQGSEAIVGGDLAKRHNFKYHVCVYHGKELCGGAIIADQYILTAAHCVTNLNGQILHEPLIVIAGTNDLLGSKDGMFVLATESVYIHKDFNYQTKLYDIAVLKLTHSLPLSHHHHTIQKINLPKPDEHIAHVVGTFTGYGDHEIKVRTNSHGQLEEYDAKTDGKLRFASVQVVGNDKCEKSNDNQFCGQMIQDRHPKGICSGDSGGPLVHAGKIIGILSLGPLGCSEEHKGATYTRVSAHLHFINCVIHGRPNHDVISAKVPFPQ